jgi:undecaprenyl diphosphate synthase
MTQSLQPKEPKQAKHTSSTQDVPEVAGIPKHIAIIMDGNGRWATKRFLPRVAGHSQGLDAVRDIVKACGDLGVEYLTLFAFSSENWRRPAEEVGFLMKLFLNALEKEISRLHRNNVCLRLVGDLSRFDPAIQERVKLSVEQTANNTGLNLTIAANYGGRWDVIQGIQSCLKQHPGLNPNDLTEELLTPHLSMSYAPEPDLFIRTGGEQRISNFLLWQLAYTELYFTDVLWPDFDAKELAKSFDWYRDRERRFGRTSAQVSSADSGSETSETSNKMNV